MEKRERPKKIEKIIFRVFYFLKKRAFSQNALSTSPLWLFHEWGETKFVNAYIRQKWYKTYRKIPCQKWKTGGRKFKETLKKTTTRHHTIAARENDGQQRTTRSTVRDGGDTNKGQQHEQSKQQRKRPVSASKARRRTNIHKRPRRAVLGFF